MKNRIIIVLGLITAILSLITVNSKAAVLHDADLIRESYQLAEEIYLNMLADNYNSESENQKIYKIYNDNNELIYQSGNPQNKRLKKLLRKSDLLTEIDHTRYYKLSH